MRPTKYTKETPDKVIAFADRMTVSNFLTHCGFDHLALELGVCTTTIDTWRELHPLFLGAVKYWQTKRNAFFYEKLLEFPPAIWIFISKNWLDLSDKRQMEVSGAADKPPIQFTNLSDMELDANIQKLTTKTRR